MRKKNLTPYSNWASLDARTVRTLCPLHVAPKSGGGWRPCGNYRRLNDSTEFDRYPVPRIHDFTTKLAGKKIFSKVDLIRGYHKIPIHQDDVQKTAIITPFGLFEFLRMPFGLKNTAQGFQRLMDSVCAGLDFVFEGYMIKTHIGIITIVPMIKNHTF